MKQRNHDPDQLHLRHEDAVPLAEKLVRWLAGFPRNRTLVIRHHPANHELTIVQRMLAGKQKRSTSRD